MIGRIQLTDEQQAILDGVKGEVLAKVLKTLVRYGEIFGATRLAEVTGKGGHLVTSFGLGVMKPMYALMDELIDAGLKAQTPFTVDPRPLDKVVPKKIPEKLIFRFMYSKQTEYEVQLKQLGLVSEDGFTCTCYLDEVGNQPQKGDVLSWAESSAVVYANSVLGARCNRNSAIFDLFGLIAGYVPYFGLLTDEGRQADWVIELDCRELPEAQILGSAIGLKVMADVPYIKGLSELLGSELTPEVCAYLKDMGAASASNGAVGLFHVDKLTPEAAEQGATLIKPEAKVYRIDDAELARVRAAYPLIWKNPEARPELCFVGCPHLSSEQLQQWATRLAGLLAERERSRLTVPTVFTAAPAVLRAFKQTNGYQRLADMGVKFSSTCPLMYMNNPLCGKKAVITNSNKLRTYTSARYYTDAEIADLITGGSKS